VAARTLAEADKAVTSLRREHDAVLFSGSVQTDAAVKVAAERLRLAVARQDFLRSLDTSLITIPVDKPVALAAGAGEGKLLDAPAMAPAEYCQRNGLDLLVGGTVREVQGYLLVQVWAWDATRASFVISIRNAALREELYGELPSIASELTTVVLGKDWALVAFAPQPPESSLYVDGALVASGASPAIYLDPGAREIRISAPGYDEISRTLTLAPGASVRLDDALSKTQPGTIEVASDPPGATLYVDSLWAGVTPIAIERPAQRSRGVLDLKGYYPGELELGPSTAGAVSLTLTPDTGPRDVRQNKARDDFYASFAWFAASIPIPLFSYALVFDFAVETQDFIRAGQLTDAVRAQSWSRAFLYSYYGGVALSTGLFAWMVVRIVQYVAAANAGG
jgi:hypothetical protein